MDVWQEKIDWIVALFKNRITFAAPLQTVYGSSLKAEQKKSLIKRLQDSKEALLLPPRFERNRVLKKGSKKKVLKKACRFEKPQYICRPVSKEAELFEKREGKKSFEKSLQV